MSGTMLSDVELTLLSLVAEGARYGAEIERLIDERGLHEWLNVGSASCYYVLTRLEAQGLLTRAANGSAEQAVFQITDAGRGVVQTAVADLLREPRSLSGGFVVGLANIGALKPRQAYHALLQHREALSRRLQTAETRWSERQSAASIPDEAMYTHSLAVMRAELDWLNGFIAAWSQRHPAVEREETSEQPSSAPTQHHRPTVAADQGKHIQKIKRPK